MSNVASNLDSGTLEILLDLKHIRSMNPPVTTPVAHDNVLPKPAA